MAKEVDYDALGEMLIRREEAKLERSKAKAKSLEKNMEETISELLKQERIKKALARDAMAATKSTERDSFLDKASQGIYEKDRELITGFEERPWEKD